MSFKESSGKVIACQKRLKKLQKYLAAEKLDGLIIRTNEGDNQNVRYLSNFGGSSGALIVTPKVALLVTDARYFIRAAAEAKDFKLVKMQRGKKFTDTMNEAFKSAGLGKK